MPRHCALSNITPFNAANTPSKDEVSPRIICMTSLPANLDRGSISQMHDISRKCTMLSSPACGVGSLLRHRHRALHCRSLSGDDQSVIVMCRNNFLHRMMTTGVSQQAPTGFLRGNPSYVRYREHNLVFRHRGPRLLPSWNHAVAGSRGVLYEEMQLAEGFRCMRRVQQTTYWRRFPENSGVVGVLLAYARVAIKRTRHGACSFVECFSDEIVSCRART